MSCLGLGISKEFRNSYRFSGEAAREICMPNRGKGPRSSPKPAAEPDERRIAIRLPQALWDALEEERESLEKETPGIRITASDAIRRLLWQAIQFRRQATAQPGTPQR
jgi:hypothetical protein